MGGPSPRLPKRFTIYRKIRGARSGAPEKIFDNVYQISPSERRFSYVNFVYSKSLNKGDLGGWVGPRGTSSPIVQRWLDGDGME